MYLSDGGATVRTPHEPAAPGRENERRAPDTSNREGVSLVRTMRERNLERCCCDCDCGASSEVKDIRLVLALGASEPCHSAEDDDEDDADEETPAIWRVSAMLGL